MTPTNKLQMKLDVQTFNNLPAEFSSVVAKLGNASIKSKLAESKPALPNIKAKPINKPENKAASCTYTYREEISYGEGRGAGEGSISNDPYISPKVELTGAGQLRMTIKTDKNKMKPNLIPEERSGKKGQEKENTVKTLINGDVDNPSLITNFQSDFVDPFNPKEQHFRVYASCSDFKSDGTYKGRIKAEQVPFMKSVEKEYGRFWF